MFYILTILLCFQLNLVACDTDFYSKFQQHDYKLEFIRLSLVHYNKDLYEKYETVTFKYNRSLAVANVTFQQKVQFKNSKMEVVIQAFKFLSNEYRIFPMRFELNVCRLVANNIAGISDMITSCGNITNCHFKKGVIYHVCNVYPNPSRFPPFIPSGEYMIEITVIVGNLTLVVYNAYGKIYRPIKIK